MFSIFSYKKAAKICAFTTIILFAAVIALTSPAAQTVSVKSSCRLPVIMYHQVCTNTAIYGDYVIPPSTLESDFEYMKNNGYTPVSLAQLNKYVTLGTPLPEKPILITFDDGERSFLTRVVPLLEKYGYPAVVNVIGSLADLYTENGETDDSYAYLNAADLKALSENPLVEIGCHTYGMHELGARRGMGKMQGESESDYCAALIADYEKFCEKTCPLISGKTNILAYPFGICNDTVRELARSFGFKVTLTCHEKVNTLTVGGSLYELDRFNRPYGISTGVFFEKLET